LQNKAERQTIASLVVEENHVEFFLAKFDGRLRGTHLCSEADFWIGEVFFFLTHRSILPLFPSPASGNY
jgi:hypothetical protein